MTPDSTLCADACQETLSQAASIPLTVEPEEPVEHEAEADDGHPEDPGAAEAALAWQEPPEPDCEAEHEEAREVGRELVVEPGARGGERPEVADVVVERAERLRLRDVAEHDPESEGHRGERAADGRGDRRHATECPRTEAGPRHGHSSEVCAESVRIAGARRRLLYPRPRCAPRSSPSPWTRRGRLRPARRLRDAPALAGSHVRAGRPVHHARAGRDQRAPRAEAGRADDPRARALERHDRRPGDVTAMQKRLATTATAAGVNGDYFTFATGRPRDPAPGRPARDAAEHGRRARES